MNEIATITNEVMLTGPGRGSAAGSLVAYALNITQVDPLKYGLQFARFLRADATDYPDIDYDVAEPMELKKGIEMATEAIIDQLKKVTTEVKGKEQIAQVATMTAVDRKIGDLIAEVMEKVGKDGVITVEESKGLEYETEYVEGMQFDRGYISAYFVTNTEKMESVIVPSLPHDIIIPPPKSGEELPSTVTLLMAMSLMPQNMPPPLPPPVFPVTRQFVTVTSLDSLQHIPPPSPVDVFPVTTQFSTVNVLAEQYIPPPLSEVSPFVIVKPSITAPGAGMESQ